MSDKEYCEDCLYDDVYSVFHELKDKGIEDSYTRCNQVIEKIQPGFSKHRADKKELKAELKKAVLFLAEGKKIFMPHTTNSFIDDFLEKHKELLKS